MCGEVPFISFDVPISSVYHVQVEKNGEVQITCKYGTPSSEFENSMQQKFTEVKDIIFEPRTHLWVGQMIPGFADSLTMAVIETWITVNDATVIVDIKPEGITFWGTEKDFQNMAIRSKQSNLPGISLIRSGTYCSQFVSR